MELREWILQSQHSHFSDQDIPCEFEIEKISKVKGQQEISIIKDQEKNIAFRNSIKERDLIWTTTVIYSHVDETPWVSIQVNMDSQKTQTNLPSPKVPIICKTLSKKYGAEDGLLSTGGGEPHFLTDDEDSLNIAKKIIESECGNRLPVVFISKPFYEEEEEDIETYAMAGQLSGIAHVVVEPSRDFSKKLMVLTHSRNVYGGALGVYWPDSVRRKISLNSTTRNINDLIEEIRKSLLTRRSLSSCTWSTLEINIARYNYDQIKENDDPESLKTYIELCEKEINVKEEKLKEAERKIEQLSKEIKNNVKYNNETFVGLKYDKIQELYENEINCVIFEVLDKHLNMIEGQKNRTELIIRNIIENNKFKEKKNIIDNLKKIFKGYKKMNNKISRDLKKLGFSLTDDGKHYKMIFKDDPTTMVVISKTSSDNRTGENTVTKFRERL
ncbi:LUC7 domain-containing protein [Bombella apis]|uniref:hypothetical protein n=1 Tax=Bombella apis TaxID=1785988 RepID=UPI0024A7AA88|nr:hypothetical protein [Bombella apis]